MKKNINFNYKNLSPFKWFVLENFPFLEADFDALTEWQLFCKLGKEMNKIINSENTLGTQMENVTNAFIELQNYVNNYFENLDVQDEINNKLNEMAQDGTLQEIIAEYLNTKSLLAFDNVSDMINSENLIEGSYAQTLGFHNINDGGSKKYKIIKEQNAQNVNGRTKINLLHDDLYAISLNDKINVREYGAKGDGITDDTEAIQFCIDNFPHRNIYIPNGEYLISSPLKVKMGNEYQVNLILEDNAIIKTNTEINALLEIANDTLGTYNRYSPYGKMLVQGGVWDATNTTYTIYTTSNRKFTIFKDLYILNVENYGIYLDRGTIDSISTDARLFNVSVSGLGADINPSAVALYLYGTDNEINELRIQKIKKGIVSFGGDIISNLHITGSYSKDNITAQEYNDSVGLEIKGETLANNIYVDTMGVSVLLSASLAKFICSNFYTFYWKKDASFTTSIFKYNVMAYVKVNNCILDLPNIGTVKGVDISSVSDQQERNYFIYRKFLNVQNLTIGNKSKLNQFDKILTYQVQNKLNNVIDTYPRAWTLRMQQNKHYKIAGLKEGLYILTITNNSEQMIRAIVDAKTGGTINVTNIINKTHTGEYSLNLVNEQTIDNQKYYLLTIKSNTTSCFYSPTISIENIFTNEIYEITKPEITIENPTVIATANFNP